MLLPAICDLHMYQESTKMVNGLTLNFRLPLTLHLHKCWHHTILTNPRHFFLLSLLFHPTALCPIWNIMVTSEEVYRSHCNDLLMFLLIFLTLTRGSVYTCHNVHYRSIHNGFSSQAFSNLISEGQLTSLHHVIHVNDPKCSGIVACTSWKLITQKWPALLKKINNLMK